MTNNGQVPIGARPAAGFYLQRGYVPVPVPRVGDWKAPALEGWPDLRPTADDLERLFPDGQDLNVGLLLGAPSQGLIDIDLDAEEAVAIAPLLLPPTGWVSGRAGKPRSHWWYVVADPPDKAADKYRDIDGEQTCLLEVRSTKGQTIVPPSVHASGEEIVWHSFIRPAAVDFTELFAAARSVAAVALLARHWPGKNSRQDSFLALTGGLLRVGGPQDRVERFVAALAVATDDEETRKRIQTVVQTARKLEEQKAVTGWPRLEQLIGTAGREVVRRAREWLATGPNNGVGGVMRHPPVRKLEPYQPFPVEVLPAPISAYVRQGAIALGCDPAYLALPALAVAAGMIGYTRVLRLKRTWREAAVIWSLIIGESGTLKSPAYRLATDFLFTLQRRLHLQFQEDHGRYRQEKAAHDEAKRQARKDGTDPGEPPKEPVEKIIFSTDATIEALAEIIEDNPRGLLVTCDELTAWFSMFARYHTGKQGCSDLPRWLSMHSAGGFSYHRKTGDRRRIVVPHAAVSVTGGIQPGVLARSLTPEFLDAGLAARLLMVMPPKQPKRWTEAEVDPDTEAGYQTTLQRLLALDFDSRDGEKVPHILQLSPEAKALWVQFFEHWSREQDTVEGELAAAYSKLEAYAARFALLHHVVTHVALESDDLRPVGIRSMEAGMTLARWFAREARRIYATLSESTEQRECRRLVEFIQGRGGRITVRQLMRANCRRYPDAEAAESALVALIESGLACWVEPVTTMKGGKPIRAVMLCMTHDTDDTDPSGEEGGDDGGGLGPHDNDSDPRAGPPGDGATRA